MCGINGILSLNGSAPVDQGELLRVRDCMKMRGPDSAGYWVADTGEIGLGHRRLAIIDLSPLGNQPMSWANDRYQIVFNGEIYNFSELRQALIQQGVVFHSNGDTEVILALYDREGTEMLSRLRGMYTFALWDNLKRQLLIARDPYGIKPLYYTIANGQFKFASQVKALESAVGVSSEVSAAGLTGFLLWGSVPEPYTFRQAIQALPAGHYLTITEGRIGKPTSYHRLGAFETPLQPSIRAAIEDTVRAHLIADVPVGIFLSAGLDSAMLAAVARRCQSTPPVTLTVTFDKFLGTEFNEGPLAARIAQTLGTNHIERCVNHNDFLDLWPKVMAAMDQPTLDGFNTFVISQIAHEAGLKVVMSGLGGDELFGSYPSFSGTPKWVETTRRIQKIWGLSFLWSTMTPVIPGMSSKLPHMPHFAGTVPGAYFLRRALFLPEDLPRLIGTDLAKTGLAAYKPLEDASKYLSQIDKDDSWLAVHIMEFHAIHA